MEGLDPAIGYPSQIANDAIPVSNHPMEMSGSSPVMTGPYRCALYVNSKGGLALPRIRVFTVEAETRRQRTAELAQASQGPLTALIPANLECSIAGNANLDLVAFLEFQRLDNSGR